mmetsp:Transcript_4832/g.12444  ORF Transcript_4832/g.12444 Transcript_4832/m.12444 type:complete len:394 (-) Transcript_4832:293-1474(-)
MPTWGQLGCNGLIVLDGGGRVVCRSSPAFLDVREQAFEYVETLLNSLIPASGPHALGPAAAPASAIEGAGPAAAATGALSEWPEAEDLVQLQGLVARPDLNGRMGICVGGVDSGTGRCSVRVGAELLALRPQCVHVVQLGAQRQAEAAAAAACATGDGACTDRAAGGGGDGGCVSGKCRLPTPSKRPAVDSGDGGDGGDGAANTPIDVPASPAKVPKAVASARPDGGSASATGADARVSVPSVGVATLDAQHEACALALDALLAAPCSAAAAHAVRDAYNDHFCTEEALLDAHFWPDAAAAASARGGSGVGGGGFSAKAGMRRSHLADHARLVAELDAHIAALESGADAHDAGEALAVARRVASNFGRHATEYDGGYAAALAAALGRAEGVRA